MKYRNSTSAVWRVAKTLSGIASGSLMHEISTLFQPLFYLFFCFDRKLFRSDLTCSVSRANPSGWYSKRSSKTMMKMASSTRLSTSYTAASTSYPTYLEDSTTTARPLTGRTSGSTGRPRSSRPRTATSTILGVNDQQIIAAVSESRGISPVVGVAFVNLTTSEAVLCQISDSQTFVRTLHKLAVYQPTEILFMSTAAQPKSKLFSFVETNRPDLPIVVVDRKYWSETAGIEYIQQLAFKEEIEAIKVSVGGNFYATCCFAAVCWVLLLFHVLVD